MDEQIVKRIEDLQPVLGYKANYICNSVNPEPFIEQCDIEQEMAIALLERARRDEAFCEQASTYLAKLAEWRGLNAALRTKGHVDAAISLDTQEYAGQAEFAELIPDSTMSPEDSAVQAETIEELLEMVEDDPRGAQMVRMFYLGYSETEIAGELGVSQAAISQRKRKLAGAWRARHNQ